MKRLFQLKFYNSLICSKILNISSKKGVWVCFEHLSCRCILGAPGQSTTVLPLDLFQGRLCHFKSKAGLHVLRSGQGPCRSVLRSCDEIPTRREQNAHLNSHRLTQTFVVWICWEYTSRCSKGRNHSSLSDTYLYVAKRRRTTLYSFPVHGLLVVWYRRGVAACKACLAYLSWGQGPQQYVSKAIAAPVRGQCI